MSEIRGIHVSPGIYTKETELSYAVKSLGITTLGLAGETLRGPAFQSMHIENWREYVDTFGGTSPEKFKGSQYPKYELPYIAKSYLSESKQLEVVRVLGLSVYKAGPAWVITANVGSGSAGDNKVAIAVLRSRAHYENYRKYNAEKGDCNCSSSEYDSLVYNVGEIKRTNGICNTVQYNEHALKLTEYNPLYATGNECEGYNLNSADGTASDTFAVNSTNYGRFTIMGISGETEVKIKEGGTTEYVSATTETKNFAYPVSLNPFDKDYILKVLGTSPENGDTPIYVESLYDVALEQGIFSTGTTKIESINKSLEFYDVYDQSDFGGLEPVTSIVTLREENLTRRNIGQRYLVGDLTHHDEHAKFYFHPYHYDTNLPYTADELKDGKIVIETKYDSYTDATGGTVASSTTRQEVTAEVDDYGLLKVEATSELVGQIVTVTQYTTNSGKRVYLYRYYLEDDVLNVVKKQEGKEGKKESELSTDVVPIIDRLKPTDVNLKDKLYNNDKKSTRFTIVKNNADNLYYRLTTNNKDVTHITCDMNNYASAYRYASTPWFVSNLKGDAKNIEVNKLFRFHTISDGNSSNFEVKVSIENIRPDEGVFDVVIRDINDTDEYTIVLERYNKVSLIPGSKNFIAYKIGSFDGSYETKSKYVTVEVADGTAVENSVPAGFLGYPKSPFAGYPIIGAEKKLNMPYLKYNKMYDSEVKNRKQYFGLSSRVGVDIDVFTFKGVAAYIDGPEYMTQGFHLDSRIDKKNYQSNATKPNITVDGVNGYEFDGVDANSRTATLTDIPVIGSEESMYGTIYQNVNLRKFTVYFYGGFDGWDVYRTKRSNTDDFKLSNYRGTYDKTSGEGKSVNRISDPEMLDLNQNGITSDWYAYLSAYRKFANPEAVDINVFATPGIDYVNNKTLVQEVIDMIEEERADSVYVVTTPDKPSGAGDYIDEMYTPDDAVYNLEDSEIDSNYTCTYYPWVKYLDTDNNQYIYLPPTKDVVRNFAMTDNTSYPWMASAGLNRGTVNCVRAHFITKLADEDTLYDGRINPIKTFSQEGPVIWGQKTLQNHESQLDRIAVRRLLLRMRKLIAIACRPLIFEPNDPMVRSQFLTAITPIMDNIKANRGISDYKIEVDNSIEAIERRELNAKLYFKPYNALEYINLEFILTPEGVSFDNI